MSNNQSGDVNEFELLKKFREGAIIHHFGVFMADSDIQDRGMKMLFAASGVLEESHPDGLMALEPLLDDPEPGVRADAAGRMIGVIPERAIAILEELKDSDHLEASTTSRGTLLSYTMRTGGDWHRYS